MSGATQVEATNEELHMAEKLVENAALQQKTAFQFDTLTPKTRNCEEEEPTRDDDVPEWKPHLRGAKSLTGSVFILFRLLQSAGGLLFHHEVYSDV